jgi:PhnB protein
MTRLCLHGARSGAILLATACGPNKTPPPTPPPEPAPVAEAEPVAPIPEGFFSLTPQLVVSDIETAVAFYGAAFDARPSFSMPGPDGETMHVEIEIGDSIVMIDAEDAGMKSPTTLGGTPATLMVYVEDADAVFERAIEAGASVDLPLADQFWGDRYGQLLDPAGHRWAVATHIEDLTDEQMQQRAELMMAQAAAAAKKPKKKNAKLAEPAWKTIEGTPAQNPVPSEYHAVTLALTASDASAAIAFYEEAFGATEINRMPTPDGKLMHAEVQIGDSRLMLADEFPEMGSKSAAALGGSPVMIHHYVDDAEATFAKATQAGAIEILPLADVFWGDRYGAVADPSGFGWGIATHIEDVPPEEMSERMQAAGSGGS